MRPTTTSNMHNGRDVNILKVARIVVKELAGIGVIGSRVPLPGFVILLPARHCCFDPLHCAAPDPALSCGLKNSLLARERDRDRILDLYVRRLSADAAGLGWPTISGYHFPAWPEHFFPGTGWRPWE